MRRCIANGTLVSATDTRRADLWIEDEKILGAVQPHDSRYGTADEILDATGSWVLPGGIDVHTHLDLPVGDLHASDDFETGTIAAAWGGTTTVIDFVNHSRGQSLGENVDAWHAKAQGHAAIDYGFHMTIADAPASVLEELPSIVAGGITSFKVFLAYPNRLLLDDPSIFRVMQRARDLGALVLVHAEAGPALDVLVAQAVARGETAPIFHALTRPEAAEASGTERALALAEMAHAAVYIVHVSCSRALERVIEGRARGLRVLGETCPQYLCLSEDALRGTPADPFDGAKFVCTPPLRPAPHQARLWQALAAGELDVVATDHCPFNMRGQKDRGRHDFTKIPNGLPGIETRMPLLFDAVHRGQLTLNRLVEVAATAPAKIFGLYPSKGSLEPGADADLVIWDPRRRTSLDQAQLHMRVDYSPYAGRAVQGGVSHVLSRGEVIVADQRFSGRPGRGRFLKRPPGAV